MLLQLCYDDSKHTLSPIKYTIMATTLIKFPDRDDFSEELRLAVKDYFVSNNISDKRDYRLFIKTAILLTLADATFTNLVFYTPSLVVAVLEAAFLGLVFVSIGFNVMHDASHQSYSSKKWINTLMLRTAEMMGASSFLWIIKHVNIHHTVTNTEHDDDLHSGGILRLHPGQPHLWRHRFQHWYAPFAYMLLYINWIWYNDIKKYFGRKIHTTEIKKISLANHLTFWSGKVFHGVFMVAIPWYRLGFASWLIGYLVFAFVLGFIMSIVFQLAHVVEKSTFPTSENGRITHPSWATIQIMETCDFGTRNKVLTWFLGGLNFQVEHHVFPKISHVHYPAIQPIVKRVCEKYQIPYTEFPTLHAIASHFRMLKKLGQEAS